MTTEQQPTSPSPTVQPTVRRVVRAVEVQSHGVENSQYFQGAGSDDFDDVYTGVGNSEREALEDALDSLAQSGTWEFSDPDATEPDTSEYSAEDEVGQVERDSMRDVIGDEPEPWYRVALFPFNGCGPIVLRDRLETIAEARSVALTILGRKRSDGFEVSEVKAFESWDVQREGSGVGDDEGLLSVEEAPESRGARRDFEKRSERFQEQGSDLYYYVSVRVSGDDDSEEVQS